MPENIRKPVVSGQFYPADKRQLEQQVKGCLTKKKENAQAGIVPHAGYSFSGKLTGKVFSNIQSKENIIILGVNHSGFGSKISLSERDFETPLGVIKNNIKLGQQIKKKLTAEISDSAHESEHSIEVQLPFIQITQPKAKIIPILLSNLTYEECKKTAEILSKFIDEDIGIIISGDFTHYGENYRFVPFTSDIKNNLYKLDKNIINEIINLNSKKVYEKAAKSTVCGICGITIITEIAKIKNWKAKLIDYYASGEISGDWDTCVGYAGIVFQ